MPKLVLITKKITVKTNLNSPGNITIDIFEFVSENNDFALAVLTLVFSPKVMPTLPDFISKVFNVPSNIKLRNLMLGKKSL